MYEAMVMEMPLKSLAGLSGRLISQKMVDALVETGSGHPVRGTFHLISAALTRKK